MTVLWALPGFRVLGNEPRIAAIRGQGLPLDNRHTVFLLSAQFTQGLRYLVGQHRLVSFYEKLSVQIQVLGASRLGAPISS
jgi:hypothetical protein